MHFSSAFAQPLSVNAPIISLTKRRAPNLLKHFPIAGKIMSIVRKTMSIVGRIMSIVGTILSILGFLSPAMVDAFRHSHALNAACRFRTALAIDRRTDNAARISRTFATGVEPLESDMGKGFTVSGNAHGGRGARFGSNKLGFVRKEAATAPSKGLEAFCQAACYELRHPKMEGGCDESGGVTCRWQVG